MAKKQQVTKIKQQELANEETNPFTAYGSSMSGSRSIIGKLLKFTKGDYTAGQENEEVAENTRLVANMDTFLIGWQKWLDDKPSGEEMGLLKDSYTPPRRDELGDTDQEKWGVGPDGNVRDPWQFTNRVILKKPGKSKNGEGLFTFITGSRGGIGAMTRLCQAYGEEMRAHPDENPVVTLGVGSYVHSDFGKIKFPIFSIVGWEKKALFEVPESA